MAAGHRNLNPGLITMIDNSNMCDHLLHCNINFSIDWNDYQTDFFCSNDSNSGDKSSKFMLIKNSKNVSSC